MDKCHTLLDDDKLPSASLKLVSQMLEVLETGTEQGKPVALSGARLAISESYILLSS